MFYTAWSNPTVVEHKLLYNHLTIDKKQCKIWNMISVTSLPSLLTACPTYERRPPDWTANRRHVKTIYSTPIIKKTKSSIPAGYLWKTLWGFVCLGDGNEPSCLMRIISEAGTRTQDINNHLLAPPQNLKHPGPGSDHNKAAKNNSRTETRTGKRVQACFPTGGPRKRCAMPYSLQPGSPKSSYWRFAVLPRVTLTW